MFSYSNNFVNISQTQSFSQEAKVCSALASASSSRMRRGPWAACLLLFGRCQACCAAEWLEWAQWSVSTLPTALWAVCFALLTRRQIICVFPQQPSARARNPQSNLAYPTLHTETHRNIQTHTHTDQNTQTPVHANTYTQVHTQTHTRTHRD